MKITIDVPEWAIGRHIYIFAGSESLARKLVVEAPNTYGSLEMKASRCNKCGKCCMNLGKRVSPWKLGIDENGNCRYLKEYPGEYVCEAGSIVPFSCCKGSNEGEPHCTVTFKPVE